MIARGIPVMVFIKALAPICPSRSWVSSSDWDIIVVGFIYNMVPDNCRGTCLDCGFHIEKFGPDLSIKLMGFMVAMGHNGRGFHIQHGP